MPKMLKKFEFFFGISTFMLAALKMSFNDTKPLFYLHFDALFLVGFAQYC